MNNLVVRYRIVTDRGSGFVNGNFINVFWDDVADALVIYKYANSSDSIGAVITSGPDLGAERRDYTSETARPLQYKFCDGTTLNSFVVRTIFPYVDHIETENHFSCQVAVCDIRIIGATTTDATDTTTPDGSITITASTSSPNVSYSLDPDFSGGGQLSGLFTGLLAGSYTVYAKDVRGCSTSVVVTISTPKTYGPKYRLEYFDRNHRQSRIDILERGYTGEVIPVCGSGDPFVLRYNADGELNKFLPVVSSEATLTLLSPSNFYFRELFSQDERKFKIEYYKDFGIIRPALHLIPPLDTFTNGGGSAVPWSLGDTPSVTLSTEPISKPLIGLVNIDTGVFLVTYNIDVESHKATIRFRLFGPSDHPTLPIVGTVDFVANVGNNSGVILLNASSPSIHFDIYVFQDIPTLPALSTWSQWAEANRVPWSSGITHPSVFLNSYSSGSNFSRNLYCHYAFVTGRSYTINITLIKTTVGTSSGYSSLYYTGRDDAFFPVYSPFGKTFIGPSGSYTIPITFTAPDGMSIFAFQILHDSSGQCAYDIQTATIIDTADLGTTVTINSITSDTPEIGGLQLKWAGFVISPNYSEPYTAPKNYPVTVTATDGLADLDKYDFLDKYGNKFQSDIVTLDAIANILRKTDLGLNIITAVNRLEVSMTNNALTESMFNPSMFYPEGDSVEKCDEALKQIIKSFAVRIYQRNARWIIQTVEEMVHEFSAMEFSPTGAFIQSLSIQDIMPITGPILANMKAAFSNRDQNLEVVPAYGILSFEHTLIQNPSLVSSYSFEEEDVFLSPNGVTAFKNWNVNIENSPGAEYGIKETKSFEGDFNFYYKVPSIPYAQHGYTLTLTSKEGLIEYDASDLFEFRFDYATITGKLRDNPYGVKPHYPFWVRLKWSLKVGSYYFDDITGDWSTTKKYNDIYVDTFNDPQNYKIVAPMREVTALTLESFQVEFVLTDNNVVDVNITDVDYSELKAIPTVNLHEGYRIKAKAEYINRFGLTKSYLYYQLSFEESDNSNVERIRPNDFDDDTNIKVWVLQENDLVRRAYPRGGEYLTGLSRPSPEIPIQYQYMDNVVLRSLPGGNEPPKNVTLVRNNNLNIKINFEDQFLLNDIDIDNINNSERIYKNYLKKLDGSPTQLWRRTYRSGEGKLLELYSGDFLSQYKDPGNKLTGSMIVSNEITFATIFREIHDSNKLYMFMGMELHDREYSVIFDLLELKDVVNDDKSDAIDAGFTSGFTLGFRA